MDDIKPGETVAKRKIEFPEIEPVKDDADQNATPKPRMGLGKKRFTSIAVKVMAQIYINNEDTIEEEGKEDGDKSESSKPTKPSQPTRKISRVGNKNKFASLVKLAKYKKIASRPASNADLDTVEEEPKIKMPQKPRFSATLSPEAQYSMLKGYEDLLLNNLKEEWKKEKDKQKGPLYRVKTPHHTVASLHLNGFEQDKLNGEETDDHLESNYDPVFKRAWDVRPAPYHGKLYRIDSKDDAKRNSNKEDTSKALLPKRMSSLQIDDKSVPKDKQLLLTHRFHCAMDILDKMRESQGMLVTSPRFKQQSITPADNYNAWSKEWSREFKLEYS